MLATRFANSAAVTVQAYAVSDTQGEATFYTAEDGAGTNSLSPSSGPNTEVTGLITIDQFLHCSRLATVAMIKIDTEGFDLHVLRGAAQSLQRGQIEILQFEYNWRWLLNHACLRDVFALISEKPYRFGKLVGRDLEFHDRWHPELDRFFETNYVLVRSDSPLCGIGSEVKYDRSGVGIREVTRKRVALICRDHIFVRPILQ